MDSIALSFASEPDLRDVVETLARMGSPDLQLFGDDEPFICVLCAAHRPAELVRQEPDPAGDPIGWHAESCAWRRACELAGTGDRHHTVQA